MPELPEVETIVRDLKPVLINRVFVDLKTEVKSRVIGDFKKIKGKKVTKVLRRGKFINIFFENDFVMTMHLRMTGRIIVSDLGDAELKYERTRIDFDNVSIRFCDVRKFGCVWLSKLENYIEDTGIWKLGVEPLDDLSLEEFKNIYSGKSGTVKKNLLDQSLVTGIGNIYADESCFYSGIRPDRELSKVSDDEMERLYKSVIKALLQGIENRGTSVSDYADAYGLSGSNQELLFVYGRGGQNCLKCNFQLIKCKVAGRGTVYCPNCQS